MLKTKPTGTLSPAPHHDLSTYSAEGRESTKHHRVQLLKVDEEKMAKVTENCLSNTNKEELCLEYVRNFERKFMALHPKRAPLYLIARNEFGVQKFLPTCVRPTLLPFKDMYDLEAAAAFVANYMHYEPLEEATGPPSCLPSPTQVSPCPRPLRDFPPPRWPCVDAFLTTVETT